MEVEEEVVGPKGPDLKLASRRDMYTICQNAGLGRDSHPSRQKSVLSTFTVHTHRSLCSSLSLSASDQTAWPRSSV